MTGRASELKTVHNFWNTEACGKHFVENCQDEREFYEKLREYRYRTEWHIPLLVPFAEAKGKKVLEIGIGHGADGAMFAANGGIYTGVDLTDAALEASKRHFMVLGLTGTFRKENAEALSFPDESFDLVYSHGVLHHTPDTQAAIDEVFRVLKPGGEAIVMLYHKGSFNYHVRILAWMRLRLLWKILTRAGRWKSDRSKAADAVLEGVRGNQSNRVWEIHYRNFLTRGWGYLKAKNFVHHCADGPECPIAHAFSKREVSKLFNRFQEVRMAVAHFPVKRYFRWFPLKAEQFLASHLGWYLFTFAKK